MTILNKHTFGKKQGGVSFDDELEFHFNDCVNTLTLADGQVLDDQATEGAFKGWGTAHKGVQATYITGGVGGRYFNTRDNAGGPMTGFRSMKMKQGVGRGFFFETYFYNYSNNDQCFFDLTSVDAFTATEINAQAVRMRLLESGGNYIAIWKDGSVVFNQEIVNMVRYPIIKVAVIVGTTDIFYYFKSSQVPAYSDWTLVAIAPNCAPTYDCYVWFDSVLGSHRVYDIHFPLVDYSSVVDGQVLGHQVVEFEGSLIN